MRVDRERAARASASPAARRPPSYNPSMGLGRQACGVHRHARDKGCEQRQLAYRGAVGGDVRDRYRVIVQSDGRRSRRCVDRAARAPQRRFHREVSRPRAGKARSPWSSPAPTSTRTWPESPDAARIPRSRRRIVVLQEDAPHLLAPRWRAKSQVIFQSARAARRAEGEGAPRLRRGRPPARGEGSAHALRRGAPSARADAPDLHPAHRRPLDAGLGERSARARARGPRATVTRARCRRARAGRDPPRPRPHPSLDLEGGANVIVEAVTGGTPVIASRISGNVGMLGAGYPGISRPGCIRSRRLPRTGADDPRYRRAPRRGRRERKPLFAPAAESRALRSLVEPLLA